MKSVSWGGAQTKGEAHKRELTLLHSDLLTSLSSSLTPLFFSIKKLAMQTSEIKRYGAINQSYCIIHTFDLRRTSPKYIKTFFARKCSSGDWSNGPIRLQYMPTLWSDFSSLQYIKM